MKALFDHIASIKQLCKECKVNTLFAFGSVTTSNFNSESDIDLVVDIDSGDPLEYSDFYFNLKFRLQEILHRKIDLLESKAIKNSFLRREIDTTKILIYEK